MHGDGAYADSLREYCAEVKVIPLSPLLAPRPLHDGTAGAAKPLTLSYYRSAELQRWCDRVISEPSDRQGGDLLVDDDDVS